MKVKAQDLIVGDVIHLPDYMVTSKITEIIYTNWKNGNEKIIVHGVNLDYERNKKRRQGTISRTTVSNFHPDSKVNLIQK